MKTNTLEVAKGNAIITNNTDELSRHYEQFVSKLKQHIKERQYLDGTRTLNIYEVKGEVPETIEPSVLKKSGIKNIRRLKRYLNRVNQHMSVQSINKLLHLIHKRTLKLETPSPHIYSEKHDRIQKLRKEWKAKQKLADEFHDLYVREKGLFYKITF
jgi:hypothetical protein